MNCRDFIWTISVSSNESLISQLKNFSSVGRPSLDATRLPALATVRRATVDSPARGLD